MTNTCWDWGVGWLTVLSGWRGLSRPELRHEPALVSFCSLPGPHLAFLTQQRTMGVTFALTNHSAICSCLPSFDVILQMARAGWRWHRVEYGTLGASSLPCISPAENHFNPGASLINGDYIMT